MALATTSESKSTAAAGPRPKRWYVIHVYSGFEKKVAQQIREQAAQAGLADRFEEVLVPTENVVEMRRGQKVNAEKKFFPGYVLAKLDLNDQVYHLVRNTPKVTGFLGTHNKPQPITEKEAARILQAKAEQEAAPAAKARVKVNFEIGDQVKVLDGPFASFNGLVEELDFDRSRVKVSISVFGRATPVELDFEQVEKSK